MKAYLLKKNDGITYEAGNYVRLQYKNKHNDIKEGSFILVYDNVLKETQLAILLEAANDYIQLKIVKEEIDFKVELYEEELNDGILLDIGPQMQHYNIGEIVIRDVNEYLHLIDVFNFQDKVSLFRGHSSKDFKLVPSICRNNYTENKESEIYTEVKKSSLTDLDSTQELLDYVIDLQHIGIPTRLLDWTSNPLTALFFAVSERDQEDAKVFMHTPVEVYNFNSKTYTNISSILRKYFKIDHIEPNDEAFNLIRSMIIDKSNNLFIEATYHNSRLKAQHGYFSILIDTKESDISRIKSEILKSCVGIDKLSQRKIMGYNFRGKNEEEIKEFLDEIRQKEDEDWDSNIIYYTLKRASYFELDSRAINQTEIKLDTNIIEFIIPHQSKAKIRKQLNLLGINHRTIYPDVQGLVLHIKDKFENGVI